MSASTFSRLARGVVAAFVFVCTVEALYWPLLPKPGTPLEWWQVHWLATIGEYVGLPVMGAAFALGHLRLPQYAYSALFPLCALIWAWFVYLILAAFFQKKEPNQALEPTSTAVTPPASAGDRASGTRGSP